MFERFETMPGIGLKSNGKNKNEAILNLGNGFLALLSNTEEFPGEINMEMEINISSEKNLAPDFLNSLLTEFQINKFLVTKINSVDIKDNKMKASLSGEKLKVNHKKNLNFECKGASYNKADIYEKNGRYYAECIIDI